MVLPDLIHLEVAQMWMFRPLSALLLWVLVGALASCATVSPDQPIQHAQQLALQGGWQPRVLQTDSYALMSFGSRPSGLNEVLTVYIEGDGYAWVAGRYPSDDPTPRDPLALRLALAQPDGRAAYLARPCQYLLKQSKSLCTASVWTRDRFSAGVMEAMNQGLDQLKRVYGAHQLILVGYSGGARIALELAARRQDIERIVTVAGNLDPQAWVQAFGMLPLSQAMDTAALVQATQGVTQLHLVGDQDVVIPKALTGQFVARFKDNPRPLIQVVQGNTHGCCWVEQWPEIWRKVAPPSAVSLNKSSI